jgi:hypothetical protein
MSILVIARLLVATGLLALVLAAARAHAPGRPASPARLRRLLAGALGCYAVAVVAGLAHRALLATIVLAGGVSAAALAGWLSRGASPEDPPGDAPTDLPPPEPDEIPTLDWARFDRERHGWEHRRGSGTRTG